MLVTNFRLKFILYRIMCGIYQVTDVARIHPMRERSLRALDRTVEYIERAMPHALGFEAQRDLMTYALDEVHVDGHYLEFGVFTGGTIRFMARRIKPRLFHRIRQLRRAAGNMVRLQSWTWCLSPRRPAATGARQCPPLSRMV